MTVTEAVLELAEQLGRPIDEATADWIIWERTGFPSFWMTDDPQAEMLEQARQYLEGEYHCLRCGSDVGIDGNLCTPCLAVTEGWINAVS